MSESSLPNWLSWDPKKKELTVKNGSFSDQGEFLFDLGQVIEYYQR